MIPKECTQDHFDHWYGAVEAFRQKDFDRVYDYVRIPQDLIQDEKIVWALGLVMTGAALTALELRRVSEPLRERADVRHAEVIYALSQSDEEPQRYPDPEMETAARAITMCANEEFETATDLFLVTLPQPGAGMIVLHLLDLYCDLADSEAEEEPL